MKRVAIVTSIPTPYRDPFWRFVQQIEQIKIDVYYLANGKPDRPWLVDWIQPTGSQVVPGINLVNWRGGDASIYWNPSLLGKLAKGEYDAFVIGGYNHPSLLCAICFAVRRGIPWYLMCETFQISRRSGLSGWVRTHLIKRVIKAADGAFPTGRKAAMFIEHYGGTKGMVTLLPNVPDVEVIAERCRLLRMNMSKLRKVLGIGTERLILYVGRLITRKRVSLLVEAFSRIARNGDVQLVIVGDGGQRVDLERLCLSLGVRDQVIFTGFQQPDRVLEWYSAADLLVQPSSETWGVVPIEAIASGLPVVLSDEVGCSEDLIELVPSAVSVVRHGNAVALADAMIARIEAKRLPSYVDDLGAWRYSQIAMNFVFHLTVNCRTHLHKGQDD